MTFICVSIQRGRGITVGLNSYVLVYKGGRAITVGLPSYVLVYKGRGG